MIVAKNLTKTFNCIEKESIFSKKRKKTIKAVSGVNLEVQKGQIIGLLGVNGAGKTTTIKMLSTLLEPTSGYFEIDNVSGIENPHTIRKMINVVTGGERNIYWRLTAIENLQYFGALYNIRGEKLKKRINEVVSLVGINESKDMPVERYSKGMKQRLQFARGLINRPRYLFLDEPTLGLDIEIARELRSHVRKLATSQNIGVILTTHYMAEAEELCDFIYIIHNGEIIVKGTSEELKMSLKRKHEVCFHTDSPIDVFKNGLMHFSESLSASVKINGNSFTVLSDEDCTREIVDFLRSKKVEIQQLIKIEPSFEDTILSLSRRNLEKN